MTALGKLFTLLVVGLSLLCFSYGLVTYLKATDFGWDKKHQRKELGNAVPSELEKRKPILDALAQGRQRALAAFTAARGDLVKTEARIAENQMKYEQILEEVRIGPDRDINGFKRVKSVVVLDAKTGLPEYDDKLLVAKKAYQSLVDQLNKLFVSISDLKKEINEVIDKEKKATELLNGKVDMITGKKERGLYDLTELERLTRQRALEELDDIKPIYFSELVEAQLLLKRQAALKKRRDELLSVKKVNLSRR